MFHDKILFFVSVPFESGTIAIRELSNYNSDSSENATKHTKKWAQTTVLHAGFKFWNISLPSSAKHQSEMTKFKVLLRT